MFPRATKSIFFYFIFSVLESHANHFPWGLPESKRKESDKTIILTQKHYVTGYQTSLRLPSWVGYKLTKEVVLWIFYDGGSFDIETRLLICKAKQWTCAYTIRNLRHEIVKYLICFSKEMKPALVSIIFSFWLRQIKPDQRRI